MTKNAFLEELKRKMRRLPKEESDAALEYYSEYLEDAGDVAAAISSLGSPKEIAAQIMAESAARRMENAPGVRSGLRAAVTAVLVIFATPIALPLAFAVFCVFVALIFVSLLLGLAFILSIVNGLFVLTTGLTVVYQDGYTGIFFIGSGLFRIGFSLMAGVGLTALLRLICRIPARLFRRRLHQKKE